MEILDNITFNETSGYMDFSLMDDWFKKNAIKKAKKYMDNLAIVTLHREKSNYIVRIKRKSENQDLRSLAMLFCGHLTGLDIRRKKVPPVNKKVKLSCIILSAANTEFVKYRLIPSIIQFTDYTKFPYEIIVVYNGKNKTLPNLGENIKVIRSVLSWVSRGYNQGVKHASGEYIALFHDDCLIRDKAWLDICISSLNNQVMAVSPEISVDVPFCLERLKCVPLVMKRSIYNKIGGFDEYYFFGSEELDFIYKLLSKGYTYKKVDFKYDHFRAVSTIVLFSDRSDLEFYFGLNIIPKNVIKKLTNHFLGLFLATGFNLIMYDNELHFYGKFLPFLENKGFPVEDIKRYTMILKNKIDLREKKHVYDTYKSDRKTFVDMLKHYRPPSLGYNPKQGGYIVK